MTIDLLILIVYVLIARVVILHIKTLWLKDVIGPILGAIPLALMTLGFVEDSFVSVAIALPAFFYLIILSGREKRKMFGG